MKKMIIFFSFLILEQSCNPARQPNMPDILHGIIQVNRNGNSIPFATVGIEIVGHEEFNTQGNERGEFILQVSPGMIRSNMVLRITKYVEVDGIRKIWTREVPINPMIQTFEGQTTGVVALKLNLN